VFTQMAYRPIRRGVTLLLALVLAVPWIVAAQEVVNNEAPGQTILAPSTALGVRSDPSAEEIETLKAERKQDLELLIRRTRDFRDVVDGEVRRHFEARRAFIDNSYEGNLQAEWELEEKALGDAIAYFEEFLKKYPSDPPYTPDAMYRLGELYYDKAFFEYQKDSEIYGDAQDRGVAENMDPPVKKLGNTIDIFQKLITQYPNYRSIDGAFYVLGYCLKETGREEEARLAWLNGICANKFNYDPEKFAQEKAAEAAARETGRPAADLDTGTTNDFQQELGFISPFDDCKPITEDSRFFFESWWMIGEYHFDYDISKYGVETAIAAYKKLTENPEHKFYYRGLYKLAWSYYKADMYPESIAAFSQLVEFSDSQVAERGGSLRPEAIQYLAICFFNEDWDLDMMPDSVSGMERIQDPSLIAQDRSWTSEVYEKLGDNYSLEEKNQSAIDAWNLYLEKWPLDVRSPFIQQKIALEFNKMQQTEDELAARGKLDRYGPGSEWWVKNADHPVEQNEVARMVKDALLEAAYHLHQQAQGLRQRGLAGQDPELLERAIERYNLAAGAYRKFIEQNPDTPDAYDINFNLADALFWSGQYELAKTEYTSVRDSNLDDKYRADAANFVILCLEEIIKKEMDEGRIALREQPPELEGDPPMPPELPLPPLVQELMNERDEFLKGAPDHKQAGTFKGQSAQNYYRYGHWDEAKQRYQDIYDEYCGKHPIAYVGWTTLMNMATDRNDIDERERLALLQKERNCSVEGLKELTGTEDVMDIDTVLGDVAMTRAMTMLKECQAEEDAEVCSQAGDSLVSAVGQASEHPDADKALYNAAFAFEIAQRFNSALKLYGRIINEYPDSDFVGKCLFKQASAANKFFEYTKALDNYRILADEPRFKNDENRVVAVYNSAYILTNLQKYSEAVPYWQRYSREETDKVKSIEAAFNAADMSYRAKQWRNSVGAYDDFIKRYSRTKQAGELLVKASYRTSLAEKKMGRKRDKIKAWEQTVELYKRQVNEPGSISAEYAAESHFMLIEEDMRVFEKFSIKGSQKVIDKKLKEGAEKVQSFEERYREIAQYRRPEWSLGAEFRIKYAYEVYAKAILNIPFPPLDKEAKKLMKQLLPEDRDMVMMDLEDRFREETEKVVTPMEEKAKAEYKIAVELARRGNISNEWTLLALERMNAYDPDNYPRRHNGIITVEDNSLTAPPFALEVQ
jgi:tetratricopeptide (TPR) repeat protein